MSVLIKGMEMPEFCEVCPCYNWVEDICRITDSPNDFTDTRVSDCPLVEVPTPHGDLIDSADIIDEINRVTFVSQYDYNTAYDIVGQADVVVEAEK